MEFKKKSKLGTVGSGPDQMRFFELDLKQADYFTILTDAKDKLKNVDEYQLSQTRRKDFNDKLNAIEKSAFVLVNSSIGCIDTAASPFCSQYTPCLQQKVLDLMVSHLIEQVNILRKLNRIGAYMSYSRSIDFLQYAMTVLTLADAFKSTENGPLGVFVELLLNEMNMSSIFYLIS